MLVVIYVANRAVTSMCIENFGGFHRPLNATAMAAPVVLHTLPCLCCLCFLRSHSDLLDESGGIPSAAPVALNIGVMVINHCGNGEM